MWQIKHEVQEPIPIPIFTARPEKLFLYSANEIQTSMVSTNFQRMLQLAEETFAVKNDPSQLDVNPKVLKRLEQLHPASVSELDEGEGPVAWVLLIPTTTDLMRQFLDNQITEKELFRKTPLHAKYEALYLCSAMVLKEYRGKGIAKRMTLEALEKIRKDHPIQSLFVWPFSKEGDSAAKSIAALAGLDLQLRKDPDKFLRNDF